MYDQYTDELVAQSQRWEVILIFVFYCGFFVYAIGNSIYLIVRCVQLIKDLPPADSPVSLQKGPSATGVELSAPTPGWA